MVTAAPLVSQQVTLPGAGRYLCLCTVKAVVGASFPSRIDCPPPSPAPCPFPLLLEASGQGRRPSYWGLWNWVNVMDWQLRRLNDPDCPDGALASASSAQMSSTTHGW